MRWIACDTPDASLLPCSCIHTVTAERVCCVFYENETLHMCSYFSVQTHMGTPLHMAMLLCACSHWPRLDLSPSSACSNMSPTDILRSCVSGMQRAVHE